LLLSPFIISTASTTTTTTSIIGIFRAIDYTNFQPFLVFHAPPFFSPSTFMYPYHPHFTSIYLLIVDSFILFFVLKDPPFFSFPILVFFPSLQSSPLNLFGPFIFIISLILCHKCTSYSVSFLFFYKKRVKVKSLTPDKE
jgi:hypothetical protein